MSVDTASYKRLIGRLGTSSCLTESYRAFNAVKLSSCLAHRASPPPQIGLEVSQYLNSILITEWSWSCSKLFPFWRPRLAPVSPGAARMITSTSLPALCHMKAMDKACCTTFSRQLLNVSKTHTGSVGTSAEGSSSQPLKLLFSSAFGRSSGVLQENLHVLLSLQLLMATGCHLRGHCGLYD